MTATEFILKMYPFAKETEIKTGLHREATLTQAALESAWGSAAPGNMYFGVKDSDGLNGNEQLLLTTEYIDNPDKKFPVIVSITQVGKKLWKYRVKDWFRKYKNPEECFTEHAKFFMVRSRYSKAWEMRSNPIAFFEELQKAQYATSRNEKGELDYADKLKSIHKTVTKIIKDYGLH